jgi:RNA polymerase sigma factor (sigma-70 family)
MSREIAEYLSTNCDRAPLPEAEVKRLVALTRYGHGHARRWAMNELVETNMRLVADRARAYVWSGIPYRDLMQRGAMALIRAVQLYDPSKKAKLVTYAHIWIDAKMQRYVDEFHTTIRQPVARRRDLAQVERARRRMAQALGRDPTPEELEDETGVDRERIVILSRTEAVMSLDEVMFDPDGEERVTFVEDGHADVESAAEISDLWEAVFGMVAELRGLDERLPQMMVDYYVNGMTLVELGRKHGITKQRVCQIKKRALSYLRSRLGDDPMLAATWKTHDCELPNGGPAVTRML